MISIILPTYLGTYGNCASNREEKLRRAFNSVLNQTFQNWELIIISDGCEKSTTIMNQFFKGNPDPRVKGYQIERRGAFTGYPRNAGIQMATGEWICYLDSDDMFGENHLRIIHDNIPREPWGFFNDMIYHSGEKVFKERPCDLRLYHCGTSNIIHRRDIGVEWERESRYGYDDWMFIRKLNAHPHKEMPTPEYCVCHIPHRYDI